MSSIKVVGALAIVSAAALAFQAVRQATRPRTIPTTLASIVPQGALLTIESPNFAAALASWNQSPQQKAWLASDNYSVFSNSRLLGRLEDARSEFEGALPNKKNRSSDIDATFLTQIAGRQSLFAWYDVGNLEFLYITRMTAAQAARIALLQSHAGWTPRQSAGTTFYLRKSSANGTPRTVAYAQLPTPAGDTLLLLATREDLLAQTLQLIQTPGNSVATEPWYTDALAANAANLSSVAGSGGPASVPTLHMVLNLDRLVPLDAFRTYWVQRNVTQMKQYRSAVSDLYTGPTEFREERNILLKSTPAAADLSSFAVGGGPASPSLESLAALTPIDSGVYRAAATHSPAVAITALEEKLLGRAALEELPDTDAPDPTLTATQSGDSADLEIRIDTPAPVSATFSNQALTDTFNSAALDAVLTYSTALAPQTPEALWIPIHNAVLLHAAKPWNPANLQSALQQSLRGTLTTETLGIDFRQTAPGIYTLSGPKHLYLAIRANLAILTDDQPLLNQILSSFAEGGMPASPGSSATLIAGFNHSSQRAAYARLTSLIDGSNQTAKVRQRSPNPDFDPATHPDIPADVLAKFQTDSETEDNSTTPTLYFSRDLKSLSDTFAALISERFLERPVDTPSGPALHQTVTYQWK